MPTTMVRVVSVFGISYIRFQLLVLSFQFVTMVAHLLRFAKHVRLDWSSYMRRRTPLTIPHRKRHVFFVNWGCDSLTRDDIAVRFCFHCLLVFIGYSYTICGVVLPCPSRGSAKPPGGDAVTALAIRLCGRYFTRPLPSLPLRTHPM